MLMPFVLPVVNGVVTHSGNSSGRGRYPAGRGGFRNDSYRGGRGASVGNSNGGNYKRGEFRNRGPDYVGRGGWSNPVRAAAAAVDGYQQRAFQNGNGRFGNRLNGPRQATVSA